MEVKLIVDLCFTVYWELNVSLRKVETVMCVRRRYKYCNVNTFRIAVY
jgi:hypothetical protein